MSDEYKRQIDSWIKISLVVTPLLSAAASWGVIKTTVANIDNRLTKVENWVAGQTQAMIESARAAGKSAEEQQEMNRRLERIEVILDSRLKRP
jgi:hypothetical protein